MDIIDPLKKILVILSVVLFALVCKSLWFSSSNVYPADEAEPKAYKKVYDVSCFGSPFFEVLKVGPLSPGNRIGFSGPDRIDFGDMQTVDGRAIDMSYRDTGDEQCVWIEKKVSLLE